MCRRLIPDVDTDADGLSDLTEHLLGLNPNVADSNPQVRLASWHFKTPDCFLFIDRPGLIGVRRSDSPNRERLGSSPQA